jgi:hypothetical protein
MRSEKTYGRQIRFHSMLLGASMDCRIGFRPEQPGDGAHPDVRLMCNLKSMSAVIGGIRTFDRHDELVGASPF